MLRNEPDAEFEDFLKYRLGDKDGLHAMLMAYSDECATTSEEVPVVAVGGGLGSGKEWARASKAWHKVLKTEPTIPLFHTQDFESPEGRKYSEYKDWDKPRLDAFNNGLTTAISKNHIGYIATASVRVADYEAVAAERPKLHPDINAYYFCAIALFELHKDWAEKFFPNDEITHYFESGGPHEKGLKRAYQNTVNKAGAEEYLRFSREPAFVPKDRYIELQIADKMVYECAKHSSHCFVDDPQDKYAMTSPTTGNKIWKVRYSAEQWIWSGLDIDVRWYSREMIHEKLNFWNL